MYIRVIVHAPDPFKQIYGRIAKSVSKAEDFFLLHGDEIEYDAIFVRLKLSQPSDLKGLWVSIPNGRVVLVASGLSAKKIGFYHA